MKRIRTSGAACSGQSVSNRATAQPRNSAGYSFAVTSLLPPPPDSPRRLPRFFRRCPESRWGERPREPRCPGFDNNCPGSVNSRPVFKTSCPGIKTSCPALDNNCPDLEGRCPGLKNSCPGSMSHCPGSFQLCPEFQTVAPVLKAAAPIFRTPLLFFKLLPDSYLCSSRREEAQMIPNSVNQSLVTSAPTTFSQLPPTNS